MNIKNQIRLSVLLSLILVTAISVSIVVTYQNMRDLQQQEALAADVVRGGYELTYLSNDYLINAEPRARTQWEERYASLQPIISQLKPGNSEEAQSLEIIRDYNKKTGVLFREIPEPGAVSAGSALFLPGYQQVTWSRINVQSQGLIYEAWRLRHLYNNDVNEARFWNNILVLALMALMLTIISVNYLLISRRLVRSIKEVNAGSEAFALGNLEYRIPVSSDDEIGGIAHRLNTMAEQIRGVTASRDELNREIATRKHVEDAMRKSEALLKRTGEIARVGGWELDAETLAVTWTEETYHIHEVPVGQMPPLEEAINFFHPDERRKLSDAIQRALTTGEGYDMELQVITATGKQLWTRTVCQPLIVDGKTIRLIGTFQDITERKRAEAELIAAQLQYRELFESVNIGILRSTPGPQGALVEANPAALRIFEADSREQFLAIHPSDLYLDTDQRRRISDEILANDGIKDMEVRYKTLKGRVIWGRITSIKKVSLDGQTYFDNTIEDITERKRAADEIALTTRKLTLMNDVTYQYIQNKVTGLRGYAELSKEAKTEAERVSFIEKEEHVLADIHHLIKDTQEYQEIGLLLPRWIPVEQSIRIAGSLVSPKPGISIEPALHGLELYSDPLIEKIFANLQPETGHID
ncbi:MAG: PAS domain S-box protein [Methanoregula sp.]|nr:PAS domain S-box protein [Methanoregula sp.]